MKDTQKTGLDERLNHVGPFEVRMRALAEDCADQVEAFETRVDMWRDVVAQQLKDIAERRSLMEAAVEKGRTHCDLMRDGSLLESIGKRPTNVDTEVRDSSLHGVGAVPRRRTRVSRAGLAGKGPS